MATIQQWREEFGRNVHRVFWRLLDYGFNLDNAASIDPVNVDESLLPQVIVRGAAEQILAEISHKSTSKSPHRLFREYLACNTPLADALRANNEFCEKVGEYIKNPASRDLLVLSILLHAPQQANAFASRVRALLESALEEKRVVTMTEIAAVCMEYYDWKPTDGDDEPGDDRTDDMMNDRIQIEYFPQLEKQLREHIVGQDAAISAFVDGLFEGDLLRGTKAGPQSTFLFVGPPGVGKTFLATTAAKALGLPCRLFQMNEYAHESSFHGLIGFEKTWKDAQPGQLTSFVKQNKNAILIFDEVEKAHLNTVRQFLSILEGGFLTDLYDEKDIDFTQTICIFTTNAGRDFFEDNRTRKLSSMPEKTLIDAIKNDRNAKGSPTMPSELLSRLAKGNIIGFDHMDPIKLRPIIRRGVEEGLQVYKERVDLTVEVDDETKTTLANLLMFHLGSELDARVASSRSKAFVIDLIYHIIESESHALLADNLIDRASRKHQSSDTWPEEQEDDVPQIDWHDKTARIVIDKSDPLAKRFLMPTSKQRFVVIALNDVQDRLKKAAQKEGHYELLEWWDRDDAVKRENIAALLEQRNVDAILIDPLFGSDQTKGRDYEGAINKGTIANDLLAWLFTRNDVPPVYIITASANSILNFNIADRDDYRRLGVRDIRRATFENVNQIALELALEKSLASVMAGGRSLDFKANYKKSSDGCRYELEIGSFSLVASMASRAADVFVNKAEGHSEHSFSKVIGAESAKRELRRFIRFLKDPDEYLRSGQAVSKGILLYGPPGTGKTMLAKALASEADCPFISVSGADVTATAMMSAEDDKVRDIKGLFRLARKYAPSVLFIDEIDAFAKSREGGGGNAAIVNKMLTEMDGFSTQTERPVFVIAATNSEPEKLDAALLRRFSKKVYVGLPIESERVAFLELMKGRLAGKQYGLDALDDGQIATFARLTSGSSLAEMENAVQLAQGRAAELGLDCLDYETLQDCYEELVYGEKLPGIEQELKTTAYHEAGHAFMGFAAGERFWPIRASIVGRQRFLGATFSGGDPLYASNSREDVIKRIRIALAGRATEIVFFGEAGINDGAGNDLQDATAYATTYVCTLGMDDGLLMAMDPAKALSGPLAASYAERINGILEREMKATIEFITQHRDVVQRLGEALLKESQLEREEMAEIIGDALNE